MSKKSAHTVIAECREKSAWGQEELLSLLTSFIDEHDLSDELDAFLAASLLCDQYCSDENERITEALDEAVHEVASSIAAGINNSGPLEQIRYLIRENGVEDVQGLLAAIKE